MHFLPGTATVALAVPLYVHLETPTKNLLPPGGAFVAGSVTAAASATGIGRARAFQGSETMGVFADVQCV